MGAQVSTGWENGREVANPVEKNNTVRCPSHDVEQDENERLRRDVGKVLPVESNTGKGVRIGGVDLARVEERNQFRTLGSTVGFLGHKKDLSIVYVRTISERKAI